ncbi:MAG: type II toxin-antitoxin system HicB family antitoxin [Planctomycetes bacterium]|jgi:predicted RNase H-like HicB family nuclease|nr:type II toxin-antitoxin system HicB family antitoxin [Planctomycetota bacterium]
MAVYVAYLRKARRGYSIDFYDFPGCASAGGTVDEAVAGAHEALALHIDGMVEDGDRVPDPSPLREVLAAPEAKGLLTAVALQIEVPPAKVRRVNITLPETTLRRVDDYARRHGETRSGLLARAAEHLLEAK